jgi:hypothetical protein
MTGLFTADDREHVRSQLLDWARADERMTGAAVTGSGAHGAEDAWSDIRAGSRRDLPSRSPITQLLRRFQKLRG